MRREARAWIDAAEGTIPDPELTLWVAQNAVHALIHLAIVERPGDLERPALARELTLLVTRYLRRRPRRVSASR